MFFVDRVKKAVAGGKTSAQAVAELEDARGTRTLCQFRKALQEKKGPRRGRLANTEAPTAVQAEPPVADHEIVTIPHLPAAGPSTATHIRQEMPSSETGLPTQTISESVVLSAGASAPSL